MHGKLKHWSVALVLCLALIVLTSPTAQAAETVHAYLMMEGKNIIGESTQQSLGRADSIECVAFQQVIENTGRVSIKITKRIDSATTLLIKAYLEQRTLSGDFKFFRPNPTGDGTTQQYFTISLDKARISSYQLINPNTISPQTSSDPGYEEITFTSDAVTWEYVPLKMKFRMERIGIR